MIIYKTTNLIDGKIYVGRCIHNQTDYLGSGKRIVEAIEKYGRENFSRQTIDVANDFIELCLKEAFWIKFYNSTNSDVGYNINPGMGGRKPQSNFILERTAYEGSIIKRTK